MNPLLTPRELEVVTLLANGYSNKQIMLTLKIAKRTVNSHVASAKEKLCAQTRAHLAALAVMSGLVSVKNATVVIFTTASTNKNSIQEEKT
jgi:DNA-binding CsgD family transcriptional regulator